MIYFSQEEIKDSILISSMNPISFNLAEELCRKFVDNDNETLQFLAITAVGHIARVYKKKVADDIMSKLKTIYEIKNHALRGAVDTAYDDLDVFLHISKPTE